MNEKWIETPNFIVNKVVLAGPLLHEAFKCRAIKNSYVLKVVTPEGCHRVLVCMDSANIDFSSAHFIHDLYPATAQRAVRALLHGDCVVARGSLRNVQIEEGKYAQVVHCAELSIHGNMPLLSINYRGELT